mmetsp:Transcript_1650/g.5770  ORF Transcript_1650/g.5770 Transcript_1650/m.5770 type:complete len:164 (-) Transcript_1650:506-997(-)
MARRGERELANFRASSAPGKIVVGFESRGHEVPSKDAGAELPPQQASQITLQLQASGENGAAMDMSIAHTDICGQRSEDEEFSDEDTPENPNEDDSNSSPSCQSTPLAIPSQRCVPVGRVPRVCSGRPLCGACSQCAEILGRVPCLWAGNKVNGVEGGAIFAS